MKKIKKYIFNKNSLIINDMSVSYIYPKAKFYYYESNQEKGRIYYVNHHVPFQGTVDLHKDQKYRIYSCKCNIFCVKQCNALINITLSAPAQIWLNGKLILAQGDFWQTNAIIKLNKGYNIFEIVTDVRKIRTSTIRLYKEEYESRPLFTSRLYQSFLFQDRMIDIATNGDVYLESGKKELLITNLDVRNNCDQYKLVITDSNDIIYREVDVPFSKTYTLDTNELPLVHEDQFVFYKMKIYVGDIDTGCYSSVFTSDLSLCIKNVIKRAEKLLLTGIDKNQICLRIWELLEELKEVDITKEWMNYAEEGKELDELLNLYNKDGIEQYKIKEKIMYCSKLDKKPKHISYILPRSYSPDKKYPLFLNIALYDYEYWSRKFVEYKDNEIIFADIIGRGVNFGSYVGEAAILEQIEIIKNTFSIDEDRIYILGFCGAAGSAWQITQAYPDIFAGCVSYVASQDFSMRMNVYNIDILSFYHAEDQYNDVSTRIRRNYYNDLPKVIQLPVEGITHNDFLSLKAKADIVNYLVTKKRYEYPEIIYYKTRMHRHRKAYWITLDDIQYGMKEAEVQAKIINNAIYINTSGTNGITIRIPPYVRKDNDVTIIINGITRLFKNDQLPDEIHVKVSDDNWEINTYVSCHSAKGTGLLEVYCHPLEILYNCHVLEGVAENFAHPRCTGFNPKLLVDYPTEYIQDYEYNIGENSFIILEDVLSDLEKFDYIKTASLIQYDTAGYEWKGKRYDEDYCIWQIIQHPYNGEQYILLISSNNWGYFKRFLFLRNIILPTYLHGNHPYLSNELLILTKHGIYAMYERGGELEKV